MIGTGMARVSTPVMAQAAPISLPQYADGHLVSVPDRRHGDDGPPECVGDALDLRVLDAELSVVDGAGEDEEADEEGDEEETEALDARLEGQDEDLESDGVLRQFEDPDQSDDPEEGQRGTRLGALRSSSSRGR